MGKYIYLSPASAMPRRSTSAKLSQSETMPSSLPTLPLAGLGSDDCKVAQLTPAALNLIAEFFKVLSEVSRLQIVCSLKQGPKNVSEIIEITGLGQANVSKHLRIMAQAGIVSRRQEGVCVYYQIANPFVFKLCDVVCEAISLQLKEQNHYFEQLGAIRQGL